MALIPLALVLGEVTEDLATRFGDVIGGLLNATFGNVVELILSVAALTKGLYTVVAMSLIGSILSNLLLVMGETFLRCMKSIGQVLAGVFRCRVFSFCFPQSPWLKVYKWEFWGLQAFASCAEARGTSRRASISWLTRPVAPS